MESKKERRYARMYTIGNSNYSYIFLLVDSNSSSLVYDKYGIKFNEIGGVATPKEAGYAPLIMINSKQTSFPLHEVIAHEAVHAVTIMFKQLGIKHTHGNQEPFAYTVGWLVRQIYRKLKLKVTK